MLDAFDLMKRKIDADLKIDKQEIEKGVQFVKKIASLNQRKKLSSRAISEE